MKLRTIFLIILAVLSILLQGYAQDITDNETCLECHGEEDMTGEVNGEEVSIYVDTDRFKQSIHGEFSCVDCHDDVEDALHDDELKLVDCANCHDDILDEFSNSVHGKAISERNDQLAPRCYTCHTSHYVLPPDDPKSTIYIMNIPTTCGKCHKEGSEVTLTHDIDQHNVLSHYSMSIHGEGLYRRGLVVTAVCTSCHGDHNILPHEDPNSTINRENVTKTCMKCHAQIETVHEKVIEGQLWEREPNKVPICVNCHSPHEIRRVQYDVEITDGTCLSCHSDPNLTMERDGETVSLFMDKSQLEHSVHTKVACINCHYDMHPDSNPVCKDSKPVDCSVCHAEEVGQYQKSTHGILLAKGESNAPSCRFCHGKHNILKRDNQESPSFPKNVPALCSQCHADGEPAAVRGHSSQEHILKNYTMSIHGKGLMESGLVVTAMCTNCHTAHQVLPASDPNSTVNHMNLPKTCGNCHLGIYEEFRQSVHSPEVSPNAKNLPGCSDCHNSHTITRVDRKDFRAEIVDQCGKCHEDLVESYFQTYHGKVSKLGDTIAAKCSDCHGSHSIFGVNNPKSKLSRGNIVETCKQCHPGSHRKFTGYLTHATHHDKNKYPYLFYSFWFMTSLLIGTLAFFGIHSILWLIRAIIHRFKNRVERHLRHTVQLQEGKYIRRFRIRHRVNHLLVILSFMALAVTGMTLKFPDVAFFEWLSNAAGGPAVLGFIHRVGAVVTFSYFIFHIAVVLRMMKKKEITLKGLFSEGYSMLPNLRDAKEMYQNFRWFFGLAERPKFGRWTYWEKFDYFAVFWGVAVIGVTGLILWFPETFTWVIPGWAINVATVIHSDEALLAAGFIFTIHFFNTHFRPGIFPMDPVIFTGRVPLEEFKEERPLEYQEMVEKGELDQYIVGPPPKWLAWGSVIAGLTFLTIGLVIVAAIIYGMIFYYR